MARGLSRYSYTPNTNTVTTTTLTAKPSLSRSRACHHHQPYNCCHHQHRPHHHHHRRSLQQQPSPPLPASSYQHQTLPLPSHHQRYQQQPHQRQQQTRSASFSTLHAETASGVARPGSPRYSRHSYRSPARSSASGSATPSPSPSPIASRRATPSPPAMTVRAIPETQQIRRFPRLPLPRTERCCWGLLPRRWFTCRTKGTAGIDFFSRIAFPLSFVLFNLAYWSTYLFHDDEGVNMQK